MAVTRPSTTGSSLEPPRRVRPDLRGPRRGSGRAGTADDRQHASHGSSDRSEPAQKGGASRCIGRTTGGLNSKLHAVCDGQGRPVVMMLMEGQMNDHKGPRSCSRCLPPRMSWSAIVATTATGFARRRDRGIEPRIPPTRNRKTPPSYDRALYRQRHRIENAFGRLKDWRRVATRYDRCAHTFLLGNLHRSHHHVLAAAMRPEPSRCCGSWSRFRAWLCACSCRSGTAAPVLLASKRHSRSGPAFERGRRGDSAAALDWRQPLPAT